MANYISQLFERNFVAQDPKDPTQYHMTKIVRAKSPMLLAFLHGTTQSESPLSKLRGQDHILRIIWRLVCEEWVDLHIDRFPVDETLYKIPELLPWRRNRQLGLRTHEYPKSRQSCSGCPVAVIGKEVPFPALVSEPYHLFRDRETHSLSVNMMPFLLRVKTSLHEQLEGYWPIIEKCIRVLSHWTDDASSQIGYLTIDERPVPSGCCQRRSGLHVESPGVMPLIQSAVDFSDAQFRIEAADGSFIPGAEHFWGGGLMMRHECVDGGIFMASNIAGTTAVWNCRVNDEDGDFIDAHGDIEHLRDAVGPCARTLEAGELIWMTDRTPHESLPIPASAGSQRRQYFRLVVDEVSAWFADHSTPNPLGTVPPPDVRIVHGDKFTLYPSPTRSWHCGTPQQIRAAYLFRQVQDKLYEFGLGHLSQRAFDYGLTSLATIIQLSNAQTQQRWTKEHSATGDMDLFFGRGSYYYDRVQFEELVRSIKTRT